MLLSKRIIKRYYKTLRTTEKNLQSIFDKRWERHISYKNLKQSSTDRPTHHVIFMCEYVRYSEMFGKLFTK